MTEDVNIVDLTATQWNCAKHGPQGGVVGVEVNVTHREDPPNQAYADGIHTRICMQCFVEMLNAHCCQLTEIEGGAA